MFRERHRFMKGLFAWIGYRQVAVPYERERRVAGAYLLGQMNSVFVFARLYLGVDSDWALATAPSGLVKDAWELA